MLKRASWFRAWCIILLCLSLAELRQHSMINQDVVSLFFSDFCASGKHFEIQNLKNEQNDDRRRRFSSFFEFRPSAKNLETQTSTKKKRNDVRGRRFSSFLEFRASGQILRRRSRATKRNVVRGLRFSICFRTMKRNDVRGRRCSSDFEVRASGKNH